MTTVAPNTRTRTSFVYSFDQTAPGGRELLGGKGLGLSEMAHLGVPVPAGFTITTDACRAFLTSGDLPVGLEDEIAGAHRAAGTRHRRDLRQPVESAAPLGSFGRCDLDAGDDGFDPRSRTERRGGSGAGCRNRQRSVRAGLVPAPDPDVRRGRRRHRLSPLRACPRRAPIGARCRERRRPHRLGPAAPDRALQADLRAGGGARIPRRRTRAADARRARRLRLLELATCSGVPADLRDSRGPRDRRQRDADGVREQRQRLRNRCLLQPRPLDGRARHLRRVPPECAG